MSQQKNWQLCFIGGRTEKVDAKTKILAQNTWSDKLSASKVVCIQSLSSIALETRPQPPTSKKLSPSPGNKNQNLHPNDVCMPSLRMMFAYQV